MCGRFANGQARDEYVAAMLEQLPDAVPRDVDVGEDDYYPSYNVAPQTRCPVVRAVKDGERVQIGCMRWGIQSDRLYHGRRSGAPPHLIINSRDDTLLRSHGVWATALEKQRCVIFCQGFYEWQKVPVPGNKEDRPRRVPHFVGMQSAGHGRKAADGTERRLMPLAGLWMPQETPEDPLVFTIVTTHSSKQLDFLHDRMPVILPNEQAIKLWLGLVPPSEQPNAKQLAALLQPCGPLDCYKVATEVNRTGTSNPNMILPVDAKKGGIESMFATVQQRQKDGKQSKQPPSDTKEEPELVEEESKVHVKSEPIPGKEEPPTPAKDGAREPPAPQSPMRSGGVKREETTPVKKEPGASAPTTLSTAHKRSAPAGSPSKRRRETSPSPSKGTPKLTDLWKN